MKRTFRKSEIIELLESDGYDGHLQVDSPDFSLIGVYLDATNRTVKLDILFDAPQGSLQVNYQRSYTLDYDTLPSGSKTKIKEFYDWVVNGTVRILPKLTGATEV